jgi:ceramide glucosyltransferase
MTIWIFKVLETAAAAGAISAISYYVLCMWSAWRFARSLETLPSDSVWTPPVSILKPLKGVDPDIYKSFTSHCFQNYPEYEIIFGVSDVDDPALDLVRRLQSEFPDKQIRGLVCQKNLGANTKVSNLAQMLAHAQYAHLIVNDSDILVDPDYLRRTLAPLNDSKVGLVTSLYRGIAASTLGSRLEALGISTDFIPGVLVARCLEGVRFGLGSTLAFRHGDLDTIGGFQSFVDYLADDYEIGKRIAEEGFEVRISDQVVDTFLPAYSFRDFIGHQLRWGRSIRDSRRWGYVGLLFTFGLPWALLAILFSQAALWAWILLATTIAARSAMALSVGFFLLRDRQVIRFWWLIPLRDLAALFVWVASFAGHTVAWRGDTFHLKDGKLARIS